MQLYVLIDQTESGPHTEQTVRAMLDSGEIQPTCLAWHEGITEWQPIGDLLTAPPPPSIPEGLPPIPPEATSPHVQPGRRRPARTEPSRQPPGRATGTTQAPSSTIRTVSGIVTLILGLLSVFNIGSCMHAQSQYQTLANGSDPTDAVNMFVDTVRGSQEGDPLRGIGGYVDKVQSVKEDISNSQLGAWLCMIGTGISGFVFMRSGKGDRASS